MSRSARLGYAALGALALCAAAAAAHGEDARLDSDGDAAAEGWQRPGYAGPAWPEPNNELRVMNNFVTVLADTTLAADGPAKIDFVNPREGWVFIRCEALGESDKPLLQCFYLDNEATPMRGWVDTRADAPFAPEAMRRLAAGPHQLEIDCAAQWRIQVRTMPEISFCYYPTAPHIAAFGVYDWDYLSRHVLPHVNTIVTRSEVKEAEFDRWIALGRQWIANAGLPGLNEPQAPSADDVFKAWAGNVAIGAPGYSGLIVDEFLGSSDAHYQAWSDALKRLVARPDFEGLRFYAWCNELFRQPSGLAFSTLLIEQGQRLTWERYLPEAPTLEEARIALARELRQDMRDWKEALPEAAGHMSLCLGYLCAPPESLNLNPAVDYHVFMDMQFQTLATAPEFWGLDGLMEYAAGYADEESLRWAHQLFRHYCIEGHRSRLTTDPYLLPHLGNPDFLDGLEGWETQPAEEGGIAAGTMEGFSWLQGRYPKTNVGDQFCLLTRSEKGANRLSQSIRDLEPGRLYSLKAIAANIDRLAVNEEAPLQVDLQGVAIDKTLSFREVYPSNYAHSSGEYGPEKPAYFTFVRYVFRATKEPARLVLGDTPLAPGQEGASGIAFNFVEVQPFRAP